MTLTRTDLRDMAAEYLHYFEGDRTNKYKALIIMEIFTKYVTYTSVICEKSAKQLPFIYNIFDSMIDTVLFDNGNKVLDPKDRDALIDIINTYDDNKDVDVMAKALAITTINRFYNSFRQ